PILTRPTHNRLRRYLHHRSSTRQQTGYNQGLRQHFLPLRIFTLHSQTKMKHSFEKAGRTPVAMLTWLLRFNIDNKDHVHQMVSRDLYTTTSILDFHCYSRRAKYVLKVLKPEKIVRTSILRYSTGV